MYWSDIDHSFCESRILGMPEYLNSITSLFIVFFGVYGLYNSTNIILDILYNILIILGFGSISYHFTGTIGFGLLDEIPMILCIFIGIIFVDTLYYKNKFDTFNHHRKFKLFSYLLIMILFIISNSMANFRLIFPYLFLFTVSYLYYKTYLLVKDLPNFLKPKVIYPITFSILTITLSGFIWWSTESLCNKLNKTIVLLGHPLWHFFVGHGFYNFIQVVYFIKLHLYTTDTYNITFNRFYLLETSPFFLKEKR